MYRIPRKMNSSVNKNTSKEGETIEKTFERLKNNNETDLVSKESIYTRPEHGVVYGTDIRADKFDKGLENTNKVTEHIRAKRDEKYSKRKELIEKTVEANSVQANSDNPPE